MASELERFPQFTIKRVNDIECFGKFNCDLIFNNGDWGYLIESGNVSYEGKFYDLNRNMKEAKFVPEDSGRILHITVDKKYAYFDGYWGLRAALILDESIIWKETHFKSSDSVDDSGKVMRIEGWDHEHCEICWETISDKAPNKGIGFVSENDRKTERWVCANCFRKFVKIRSLSYIRDEFIMTQIRGLNK